MKGNSILILIMVSGLLVRAQSDDVITLHQRSASRSEYFSWINHTNEGATEQQTLANLNFFKWLKETYDMQLDLYAFDAGTIDGFKFYGTDDSKRFKSQFPNGFDSIYSLSQDLDIQLGLWAGPDGFGNSKDEEELRTDLIVGLCRDYNFGLFKFDAVCGQLRPEKQSPFVNMIRQCREYVPELIVLNHRLDLGEEGMKEVTTTLLGGAETYIDVHMTNDVTAPHHRAKAIAREYTPGLNRLSEDHGVCLSSCLDYWEDDLVLHAFGRNLIVSPQIYGNPWLLADHEFARLARIFNVHRANRKVLPEGFLLPASDYGEGAISRGDKSTRLITLRNLSWHRRTVKLSLDATIGLEKREGNIAVQQYHPTERWIGNVQYGDQVEVEVLPFRTALLYVSYEKPDWVIDGAAYLVVKDIPDEPLEIQLLGMPGDKKQLTIWAKDGLFQEAILNGKKAPGLLKGQTLDVDFQGEKLFDRFHRKIGDMTSVPIPEDVLSYYEATQFAADNNSLEARSLLRSGPTEIPEVRAARDAFFQQSMFIARETWDRYMFDDDPNTYFSVSMRYERHDPNATALRIDLGEVVQLDSLVMMVPDEFGLMPYKSEQGEQYRYSKDLSTWHYDVFIPSIHSNIDLQKAGELRYISLPYSPMRVSEIYGYYQGQLVDRSKWKGSNLQRPYVFDWFWDKGQHYYAKKAWKHKFQLNEIPKGSYLCVAVNGVHGIDGAVAGFKIDGQYVGCPDRSPSYRSNTWEYRVFQSDKNYTYYLPLKKEWVGKDIEAVVLAFENDKTDLKPEVWLTAYPAPFETVKLQLNRTANK